MQIHCPICGHSREVNLEKIPPTAEFATCPKCRHRFRFRVLDPDTEERPVPPAPKPEHADVWDAVDSLQDRWKEQDAAAQPADSREGPQTGRTARSPGREEVPIPWENPRRLGFFRSFLNTTLWALLRPSYFFGALTKRPALLPAFLYYLIFGYLQSIFQLLWLPMFLNVVREPLIERVGEESFATLVSGFELSAHTPMLLALPFSLAIQLFLSAGMIHLFIRLMAPQEADFSLAIKVTAYASASVVLTAIPLAGLFLGFAGHFVLMLIGCRSAFKLSWGRSLAAILPLYSLALIPLMLVAPLSGAA
ncbi:MAG: zinc-ribbon domain-containing protein [Deltaproteobacteria bacterium]|jgi:hypothetical protein|nr:zinc-ribbon domain-containing protein [Deltaproteobacteria bacterium]